MKVWLWIFAGVFVGGIVADLLVARHRRRRIRKQDISPGWLNENFYRDGQDGDDRWK
jgi:hypothetical protein